MTPPPLDPIRPVGGVLDGDIFVARSEHVAAVRRRERHEDDESDEHPPRDRHPREQPFTAARPQELAAEAGAYDDHGRLAGDNEPDHTAHVDTTA